MIDQQVTVEEWRRHAEGEGVRLVKEESEGHCEYYLESDSDPMIGLPICSEEPMSDAEAWGWIIRRIWAGDTL